MFVDTIQRQRRWDAPDAFCNAPDIQEQEYDIVDGSIHDENVSPLVAFRDRRGAKTPSTNLPFPLSAREMLRALAVRPVTQIDTHAWTVADAHRFAHVVSSTPEGKMRCTCHERRSCEHIRILRKHFEDGSP